MHYLMSMQFTKTSAYKTATYLLVGHVDNTTIFWITFEITKQPETCAQSLSKHKFPADCQFIC